MIGATMIFALVAFLLASSIIVSAQPEFSDSELRLIKERGGYTDTIKHRLSPDKFPLTDMPAAQTFAPMADGDLDPTFNTSVTEGSGYVSKTVVQPDGKIIAV